MRLLFFLLFSMVAAASAAFDPLALNFTGDLDELEALLAGAGIGVVNRSAGDGIFNDTGADAETEPPFYHLMRGVSIFHDFQNLTAPRDPAPFSVEALMNKSFFETLLRDWW
ncbi:hypothetical protein P0O24_01465 [Methanotrichaceae archaeon M04Ac]|uniref:Uncharacterized protein n=1 Tax=Candidatus Methanocrinis alkalitolerans TaxID=3033395 RepID=A0ABT5XC17_9EURY|nr:hypothetical protein [Candidatus Methanocrinis alkalitolerans]MDF0592254.1 hypothetical protein [Candidatus Methanocrinis alkalitolerans]